MFDGPDGVGKSTQFELAAAALRKGGHQVYTTHLLGGSDIGNALRAIMFSNAERPAITNLHLSLAIYYALLDNLKNHLDNGEIVLIDRSPLSLYAYQVFGDGLDEAIGRQACQEALQAFGPQKVIVYEAPIETLLQRRQTQQAQKASDYFEQQKLDYHRRTTEGYQVATALFQADTIDASRPIEAVHTATMAVINAALAAN